MNANKNTPLPKGWIKLYFKKTGKPYYVNTTTAKWQYEVPSDPINSPPAVNTTKKKNNAINGVKVIPKVLNEPVRVNLPRPVLENKPQVITPTGGTCSSLPPDAQEACLKWKQSKAITSPEAVNAVKQTANTINGVKVNVKAINAPVRVNLPQPVRQNKPQVITPTGGTCSSLPPDDQVACIEERAIQREKARENKRKAIANGTYIYSEDELKAKKEIEEREAQKKEEKKKQAEINQQEDEKFDIAINKSIKDDELKFTIDNKKRLLYDIPKLESEITNLLEENPEFKKELYSTCDISRSPEKCKDIIEDRLYYYISHNMSKEILDADYTIDDIQTNINRLGKPYIEYIKKELQFHPYLAGALNGLNGEVNQGNSQNNKETLNKQIKSLISEIYNITKQEGKKSYNIIKGSLIHEKNLFIKNIKKLGIGFQKIGDNTVSTEFKNILIYMINHQGWNEPNMISLETIETLIHIKDYELTLQPNEINIYGGYFSYRHYRNDDVDVESIYPWQEGYESTLDEPDYEDDNNDNDDHKLTPILLKPYGHNLTTNKNAVWTQEFKDKYIEKMRIEAEKVKEKNKLIKEKIKPFVERIFKEDRALKVEAEEIRQNEVLTGGKRRRRTRTRKTPKTRKGRKLNRNTRRR